MTLVVLKFGGTSLANTKLMNNAVSKVLKEVAAGNKVIVVVSAMAGVTDYLVNLSQEIIDSESIDNFAEYASVITTGEQVSAGLFTLLLQQANLKARSWLGWQAGIITDNDFANSNIIELKCDKIKKSLDSEYQVAVVAGFQGITINNRISTLGRGGSDTSAIILAGELKASKCDIYTDVEGLFTADPRIVAKAKKIHFINYNEMISLADSGAKILQTKSVQWAKHYKIKVQILSSFTSNPGTIVSHDIKDNPVVGVALSDVAKDNNIVDITDVVKISVIGTNIDNNNELISYLQQALNKANIEVMSILKSTMTIGFIIKEEHKFNAVNILHNVCKLEE